MIVMVPLIILKYLYKATFCFDGILSYTVVESAIRLYTQVRKEGADLEVTDFEDDNIFLRKRSPVVAINSVSDV